MENNEEIQEVKSELNLVVSEEMRSYIYEIAKWASFLAIVGFAFAGITIISAFTIGAVMNNNPQMLALASNMGAAAGAVFTVMFLIIAFAIFYPSLLMFKYAAKAKIGVLYGEQASLNEAMGKLKSLFKYWGIITIVYLALYALMIIATIMGRVAV
ncbi:DUF5362 family protein [Pedobacter cryotolerans]|jgi:Family of unknown function (DUF5362)|uniref:DUF5362 domain-containing protein n=1 Tax=Pedobacter cryotolerans TaxID=2571270 RepID=A0A4U1C5T1_9SPHI|nr:DUF5362 family protein [Pedobacter cryotolerans]TKB99898.1 hypothetical protein FA045_10665 [Pedobacter cryotolerans]